MSRSRQKLTDYHDPVEAMADLCRGFFHEGDGIPPFALVEPEQMPAAYRQLLVHNEHMTTRLEAFHGRAVELGVLEYNQDGDLYTRKILLTPAGSDHVIELGIVRLDLQYTPEKVKDEIVRRKAPLGAILLKHNLLTRVEPRWYLRFPGPSPQDEYFGEQAGRAVYGRVGTIYCNEAPAIELLEIVTDEKEEGDV